MKKTSVMAGLTRQPWVKTNIISAQGLRRAGRNDALCGE
jgi:hypothetical protein